jgi:hypothetical protein
MIIIIIKTIIYIFILLMGPTQDLGLMVPRRTQVPRSNGSCVGPNGNGSCTGPKSNGSCLRTQFAWIFVMTQIICVINILWFFNIIICVINIIISLIIQSVLIKNIIICVINIIIFIITQSINIKILLFML